jgi:hypothetical protein
MSYRRPIVFVARAVCLEEGIQAVNAFGHDL